MAFEGYVVTKILHVFLAVAWIGGVLYQQVLVGPVLQKASEEARAEVMAHLMPLSLRYNNAVGGFTLLTGIALVSMHPNYGWGALLEVFWGRLVAFALIGTLAILYLINVAMRPTLRVIQEKMKDAAEGELGAGQVVQIMQKRLAFSSRLALIIGLAVLVAMVVANGVASGHL
jgi:hypothetical protein